MKTQPRFPVRIAAAAVLALAGSGIGLPLAAQPDLAAAAMIATPPPSRQAIHAQHERASALTLDGQFRPARREWARLARMQRAVGEVPIEALRMQAEIDYLLGRDVQAARLLETLAAEVEAGGDPEIGARSYLNAAILFQNSGLREEARTCWDGANRLMERVEPELREALVRRYVRS